MLNISETVRNTDIVSMEYYNRDLHMSHWVSFQMTFSDLEWLTAIFNGTKHRAVSPRQLSLLLQIAMQLYRKQCKTWHKSWDHEVA